MSFKPGLSQGHNKKDIFMLLAIVSFSGELILVSAPESTILK